MTTVLLIRHGRTKANADGVLAGWTPGVTLDEKGREQASALGFRLQPVPLVAVVTSPLERTIETADLMLDGRSTVVDRRVDDRVGECRYGDWTGGSLKTLAKDPMWKVVQAHPSAAVFPGLEGEAMSAMQHRAVSAVREWNSTLGADAIYAIVSHGDVIKAILADALGMHLDQFQRLRVDPCSVSIIDYTPLRPFVSRTNDTGGSLAGFARPVGPKRRKRASSDAVVGGGSGA
ncbi:MAG: MSMEG_4193 family putative phosphomutase [Actinobacteria bacterium]|nr:MSMEG_4193 family putative phosphomutase [Actinomycetota bacterium]